MSAAFLSSASSTIRRARSSGERSVAGARLRRFGRPSERGEDRAAGPGDYDAAWRVDPDASRMMESLASAVVARDGALFDAGESNLDWRRHALFEPEGESE